MVATFRRCSRRSVRMPRASETLLSWIHELTPMDVVDFEFPADPAGKVLATLIEHRTKKLRWPPPPTGRYDFSHFWPRSLGPHRLVLFLRGAGERHPSEPAEPAARAHRKPSEEQEHPGRGDHAFAAAPRPSKQGIAGARLADLPAGGQPDAKIIRVLDMPDARRLIKKEKLAHLFASGWFESTAYFMQPDPDEDGILTSTKSGESRKPPA